MFSKKSKNAVDQIEWVDPIINITTYNYIYTFVILD